VYIFNLIIAAYQYSLPTLKIYNACYLYYRFSVLTVNIGTQYFKCYVFDINFISYFTHIEFSHLMAVERRSGQSILLIYK